MEHQTRQKVHPIRPHWDSNELSNDFVLFGNHEVQINWTPVPSC